MTSNEFTAWAVAYAARCRMEWTRLNSMVARPEESQAEVLRRIVAANGRSAFGLEHGLETVRRIGDFQAAVPIREHTEFRPWLERLDAGQRSVLTADEPLLYLSSSGTTGDEKRIPMTRTYLRESFLPFYFAGGSRVLRELPFALRRPDAVLNLWQEPRMDGDGAPHLGVSQLDYRVLGAGSAVGIGNLAPWSLLPAEFAGADPWERAYLRLRWAVAHDVRCVFAINPAIAAALPQMLTHWCSRLLAEIADGTLGGRSWLLPDLGRARYLARLAERQGRLRPADLWPRLELLVAWPTYVAGLYLDALLDDFGAGVRVLSAPIGSAEGPVAVPTAADSSDGVLTIGSALYEFVPVDEPLAADSQTVPAHEVVVGQRYHVVLSHIGGLYRCATRDIVEVTGHTGRTPRIRFLGRHPRQPLPHGLSEPDVLRAVRSACAAVGAAVRNLRWSPSDDGHELTIAFELPRSADDVATFAVVLEMLLIDQHPAYRLARRAGTAAPVRVRAIPAADFFAEWRRRVAAGERMPRVKDRLLDPAV